MKTSRHSLFLMLLPVFAILTFGWWRQMNPPAPPQKFGIDVKVELEPISPLDVWAKRDSKIRVWAKVVGPKPAHFATAHEWLECLRLVARKNGRDETIHCHEFFSKYEGVVDYYTFPIDSIGLMGPFSSLQALALHKVPSDAGEIWLVVDIGLRAAPADAFRKIDEPTLFHLKKQGGMLWGRKEVLLRKKGEVIKLPPVSTDPQLKLISYQDKATPSPSGRRGYDRMIVMRFTDTRVPHDTERRTKSRLQTVKSWQIVDENGQPQHPNLLHFEPPMLGEMDKGQNSYQATMRFSSRMAPKVKRLRLKGAVSCDNRWPLMIDIPLLDRTRRPANAKLESKS